MYIHISQEDLQWADGDNTEFIYDELEEIISSEIADLEQKALLNQKMTKLEYCKGKSLHVCYKIKYGGVKSVINLYENENEIVYSTKFSLLVWIYPIERDISRLLEVNCDV